jgi:hypothetical protein
MYLLASFLCPYNFCNYLQSLLECCKNYCNIHVSVVVAIVKCIVIPDSIPTTTDSEAFVSIPRITTVVEASEGKSDDDGGVVEASEDKSDDDGGNSKVL